MKAPEHFLKRRDRWKDTVAGQQLSASALRLALVMSSRFNEAEDGHAYLSIATAATLMNVSRSTTKRAVRELAARGLLSVIVRKGHAANLFSMQFDPSPARERRVSMMTRLSEKETGQKQGVLGEETGHHADPLILTENLEGGAALTADPASAASTFPVAEDVAPTSAAHHAGLSPAGRHLCDSSMESEDEPKSLTDLLDELTSLLDDIAEAGIALPEDLQAFLDRDVDPEDRDAVADLLATADEIFEAHREAQHQAERVEPLAVRFADPARRQSYANRVVSYLLSIPAEHRHAAGWRQHRQIVEGLKATMPRFMAERLAAELRDEIFDETWRRARCAAAPVGNVVCLATHRLERTNVA